MSLTHHVLIYRSDAEFLAAAVPFAREGVWNGEPVTVITNDRNAGMMSALLNGRITYIDSASFYESPGRMVAAFQDHIAGRADAPRVRILGEVDWPRFRAAEKREMKRLEAVYNLVFADTRVWALCPYDTRSTPADVVAAARVTHPALVSGTHISDNPDYRHPRDAYSALCDRLEPPAGPTASRTFRCGKLPALRDFVFLAAMGMLTEDRATDLVTCVNEVATNVLKHGVGHGYIRMWGEGADVVCDVVDPSNRLTETLLGYRPPDPRMPNGAGLWLVRQLCDLVEISSGDEGLIVRLRLHNR